MSYKFENTISGQLVKETKEAFRDLIVYKGKSLNEWEIFLQPKEEKPSEYEIEKNAKTERVEKYRQQWQDNEAIEYDVDEYKLHRFQTAFVKGAVANGLIEE